MFKVVFGSYSKKDGTPEDGVYEILQYLEGLKEKDILVRLDPDMKYEGVDLFCDSLSIKNLQVKKINDRGEYEASFETKNKSNIIRLLANMGNIGNGGHSYDIKIGKKTFYFDGDGADRIVSINGVELRGDMKKPYYWGKFYEKEEKIDESMRKIIKLNESQLKNLVMESAKRVMKEMYGDIADTSFGVDDVDDSSSISNDAVNDNDFEQNENATFLKQLLKMRKEGVISDEELNRMRQSLGI